MKVIDVVRRLWLSLDDHPLNGQPHPDGGVYDFRAWREAHGFRETVDGKHFYDPGLPSASLVRDTFNRAFPNSLGLDKSLMWVKRRDKWNLDVRREQEGLVPVLMDRFAYCAAALYDVDWWWALMQSTAQDLGPVAEQLQRDDPRKFRRLAFVAALEWQESGADRTERGGVARRVLSRNLSPEIRDVAQLHEALADPDLVDEIEAILHDWAPVAPEDRLDPGADRGQWDALLDEILAQWMVKLPPEAPPDERHRHRVSAERLWRDLAPKAAFQDHRHEWRAGTQWALTESVLAPGENLPAATLGYPPSKSWERDLAPLDRSLYIRMHNLFRRGKSEHRTGYAGFDVILPDLARWSHEPFRLARVESRVTLIATMAAAFFLGDVNTDGGNVEAGPFFKKMNQIAARELDKARSYMDKHLVDADDNVSPDAVPKGGERLGDGATAGAYLEGLREQMIEFGTEMLNRVWVSLANAELRESRDPDGLPRQGSTPTSWHEMEAFITSGVSRSTGDATIRATKANQARTRALHDLTAESPVRVTDQELVADELHATREWLSVEWIRGVGKHGVPSEATRGNRELELELSKERAALAAEFDAARRSLGEMRAASDPPVPHSTVRFEDVLRFVGNGTSADE